MAHTLPDLPYAYDALEPAIGTRIMELHHSKHHNTYVTKLNAALEKHPDLADKSIEDLMSDLSAIPEDIRTAVRNNGGGHINHSMFWTIMGPNKGGSPSGDLGSAIDSSFGSFDDFKEQFNNAGATLFGSGWVFLVLKGGKLELVQKPNQDTPVSDGDSVILGNDVWEHAYYLTYENRRPDYLKAWWDVVDWDAVAQRFAAAKG